MKIKTNWVETYRNNVKIVFFVSKISCKKLFLKNSARKVIFLFNLVCWSLQGFQLKNYSGQVFDHYKFLEIVYSRSYHKLPYRWLLETTSENTKDYQRKPKLTRDYHWKYYHETIKRLLETAMTFSRTTEDYHSRDSREYTTYDTYCCRVDLYKRFSIWELNCG